MDQSLVFRFLILSTAGMIFGLIMIKHAGKKSWIQWPWFLACWGLTLAFGILISIPSVLGTFLGLSYYQKHKA